MKHEFCLSHLKVTAKHSELSDKASSLSCFLRPTTSKENWVRTSLKLELCQACFCIDFVIFEDHFIMFNYSRPYTLYV